MWFVGTHNAKHRLFRGRKLPELSHLSQAIKDTADKLEWRVTLGKNEYFESKNNKNIVPCIKLQDPEVQYIINFFVPGLGM